MRIGIFGGSFDPVHYGHLLLAEYCRVDCSLDEVWFMPAAIAPHKQEEVPTPGEVRAEMLEQAIAGNLAFQVCRWELERGGVSYTVDTLAEGQRQRPEAEFFLLMGADSLSDLPNWRQPEQICQLATPVVVSRPDAPEVDFDVLSKIVSAERIAEIRRYQVNMPLMQISSTEIRSRRAAGLSLRYQTPLAVVQYIDSRGLYR